MVSMVDHVAINVDANYFIKNKLSYLDHTIIFEDFMLYLIFDVLEISWIGIRKS